jgi:redox-sensitive bicupin YhaK (pirin superfamily)
VTVEIRRGATRFADRGAGMATWHSFSFGAHYDAANVGFGPMVCHDEHLLGLGRGFETHSHAGLEIVTWLLSGALTHTDSTGHTARVSPGTVGLLSAGSGVEHSEIADAPQTRFVQVWLTSDEPERAPAYETREVDVVRGSFVEVARPTSSATFSVARLEPSQSVTLPAAPKQHLFVGTGALLRSSLAEPLDQGDAFLIEDEPSVTVTAAVPTELLLWSFTNPRLGD